MWGLERGNKDDIKVVFWPEQFKDIIAITELGRAVSLGEKSQRLSR